MDLHEYLRLIHEAEQKSDLNQYQYKGIKIWPLLRAQVLNMFRTPAAYNKQLPPLEVPHTNFIDKLKARRRASQSLEKFRDLLNRSFSPQQKSAELLFFSRNNTHSDTINGKGYDRFSDPFIELLEEHSSFVKVELSAGAETAGNARHVPSVRLAIDLFKAYDWNRIQYAHDGFLSESVAFRELTKHLPFVFNSRHADSAMRDILLYRDLFREIFQVIKPRYVFLKCYYEHDAAGLLLAAREAGIKTVDIQHGKQGTHHPMYSHWTNIPDSGYELLPDYFWNWAEESRNNILKWMNRQDLHIPVTGGNLWLAKWKHQDFYELTSDAKEALNRWKQAPRVVLVSLQPLEHDKIIPAHLAEAIRNSPPEWIWLLRKHPFQQLTSAEIHAMIASAEANMECDLATTLPLYLLLKHVHHHITQWSSVAFEASDFGVPTIIVHETGRKLYAEHIQRNVFSWSDQSAGIIRLITDHTENIPAGYIETDPRFAYDALQHIGIKAEAVK